MGPTHAIDGESLPLVRAGNWMTHLDHRRKRPVWRWPRGGLTNREIAQRLFVTIKAVQWHLGNVYRKLDIGSRGELPAALGLGAQDKTLGRVG